MHILANQRINVAISSESWSQHKVEPKENEFRPSWVIVRLSVSLLVHVSAQKQTYESTAVNTGVYIWRFCDIVHIILR